MCAPHSRPNKVYMRNIVIISVTQALWRSLEAGAASGRWPLLRGAFDTGREIGLCAGSAAAEPWSRLRNAGRKCIVAGGADAACSQVAPDSILALSERLLEEQAPDLLYAHVSSLENGDAVEAWLDRLSTKHDARVTCLLYVGEDPPEYEKVAALFEPRSTGLSEEDAAALRERLMGLGYL